eukprot:TRINITY_DN32673_c0_g1_i1.p1 TRINITY_DN32673_c0_g1~~TRINITY_DN32673_c0_g1_i1.p1  ORF type:complete len:157 (+),score=30.16 TRINITY_DN32673_c0_g1_i1:85-555(+)
MATKLPKVKNKHPAPNQISVNDLVPQFGGEAARRRQLLHEAASSVSQPHASSFGPQLSKQDQEEEATAMASFRIAKSSLQKPSVPQVILKKARIEPSSKLLRQGPRAVFRVRPRGDWPIRRLCCIAIYKETPETCPMARLPQGFMRDFVNTVFSFL